jgi:CubicO group peptidase (beta-lactamase class C family)
LTPCAGERPWSGHERRTPIDRASSRRRPGRAHRRRAGARAGRAQIAPVRFRSPLLGDGWDFGFGVAVLRDPAAARSPLGRGSVRWSGGYGHFWWIDPSARLSAVLLTNTTFEGMTGRIRVELERAVYGA